MFRLDMEDANGKWFYYGSFKTAEAAWAKGSEWDCDFCVADRVTGKRCCFDGAGCSIRCP